MVHDNTQSLEEKLQQQVSSLLAKRFSSVEGEVQRLQASINEFCERLLTYAGNREVATEEVAELNTELRQTLSEEADRASSRAVAEAVARVEEDYRRRLDEAQAESEAQINELQAQLAASQAAAAAAAAVPAPEPVATAQGGFDQLRNAIAEIDAQRTQAEALTTLVRHASQFAPRIVFFVLKSGSAIGWKASGFDNGLNDETARSLNIPVSTVSLLHEAVEQQHPATTTSSEDSAALLGAWGTDHPQQAVAMPLTVRGKAAAVLYADSGTADQSAINTEAIETLLHVTSLVVELLPVRRSADQFRPVAPPPVQPVVSQPVAEPEPEPEPAAPVTPVVTPAPAPVFYGGLGDEQPARTEAPEEAAAMTTSVPTTPMPVTTVAPAITEAPASLVSTPTLRPVEEVAPEPAVAVATTPLGGSVGQAQRAPGILPTNASESEVRAHNDARRFARLLVSEIKLYNEAKVADGRRSHDLYERLKEDIDRSRQMYEKRVPPTVASRYDYFYDELVHTLAEGDSSKLGHGCPGPTVPVS